jgi:hypothetical protein
MGIGRLQMSANPRLLVELSTVSAREEQRLLDRGRGLRRHIATSRAIVAGDRRSVTRGLGLGALR